jgi:hypothetical protein
MSVLITVNLLRKRMDSSTIKSLVDRELQREQTYENYHGISPAKIRSFLVEPFTVRTDLDDLETQPRDMWVVLQEKGTPSEGYVIVYVPLKKSWGVAEHTGNNHYILVVGTKRFRVDRYITFR